MLCQLHIATGVHTGANCKVFMSVKQQLEAMSRTDILITPCGGVGTVLTFLPPGATAIVMNYWHTTLLV